MISDDLRSVPGWRRIGLFLGWGAVACAGAALLTWLPDRDAPGPATVVLLLVAGVGGFLAPAFLRRASSVPGVAEDPAAVRAHRCSDVAILAWGTSVVVGFVLGDLLDLGGTWLDVVRGTLAVVLVVAYVAMLILATRWRPATGATSDQL
jgi:hypothetical protein